MGVQKAYENKKIAYTQEMLCLHLSPNKPKNQNKRVKRWIIESSLEVLASSSFCKENTKHQTPTKIPSSLSLSLSLLSTLGLNRNHRNHLGTFGTN
jgi:hypothetical protein